MKRRLFLTGPVGCGKSTMIRNILGEKLKEAGGFLTVRDLNEDGHIRGVDLLPMNGGFGQRFLERSPEGDRVHLEVFRTTGADYLRAAGRQKFAVLDEVGGVELLEEEFLRELTAFFRTNQPCLGVVEGPSHMARLMGSMGLQVRYELARRVLVHYLKNDADTLLIEIAGPDDPAAAELLSRWAEEYT